MIIFSAAGGARLFPPRPSSHFARDHRSHEADRPQRTGPAGGETEADGRQLGVGEDDSQGQGLVADQHEVAAAAEEDGPADAGEDRVLGPAVGPGPQACLNALLCF